jgi:hypothetical protein
MYARIVHHLALTPHIDPSVLVGERGRNEGTYSRGNGMVFVFIKRI